MITTGWQTYRPARVSLRLLANRSSDTARSRSCWMSSAAQRNGCAFALARRRESALRLLLGLHKQRLGYASGETTGLLTSHTVRTRRRIARRRGAVRRAPCRTFVRVQTEREASRVVLARLGRRGLGQSCCCWSSDWTHQGRKQPHGARKARSPECSGLGWCHSDGWHTDVWTHVEPAGDDSVGERPRGVAEGANVAGDRQ
jgi:hypothetical protein